MRFTGLSGAGVTVTRNAPPPSGAKPWRQSSGLTLAPSLRRTARYDSAKKSQVGASGPTVAPSMTSSDGPPASSSAGSSVSASSAVLPAPTAKRYLPGATVAGANRMRWDSSAAPSTLAFDTAAAAWSAARCGRCSPGVVRRARIFSSANGFPVTSESASAVRTMWPPPSPFDASMVSTRVD